ncbi:ABC transporter permease subunit [Microbacterium paludicola]|uniref:ABC transporter permease subunit n=1 Tax=Microbacterium paludicola TaxID=300019 RepID=A0A4Y9FXS3_9MICO|nr:ABC transporter permease subunit [Microbacterium paludicola]MBF0816023.1 ABC transporter permease subunit [Microbacterium paludicola]TFU33342.1 ABC transporter permease subunit [Microbacterium paludicola]
MSTDARPARRPVPAWVWGVAGVAGIVALWWVLAATVLSCLGPNCAQPIPTPAQVLAETVQRGWSFFAPQFGVTLAEAGLGYLWGNGLALVFAALVLVVPRLEGLVMQLATITYCLPIVAIGMVLIVMLPIPQAGHPSLTSVILAALSVFFTTVVGSLLGLKAADRSALDVVTVYGGSRFTQLRKVRLIAALPAILNALQIAVPAAFLGAVLGEFFGKVQAGVGRAMMIAQVDFNPPLVWALAILSGLVALVGYWIVGLVARAAAPWSKGA